MTDPANSPRSSRPAITVCPACGFGLFPNRVGCSLCGWGEQRHDANAAASKLPVYQPANHDHHGQLETTFSFSSLLLFLTVGCVCLGVIRIAPGLGILLAIVTLAGDGTVGSVGSHRTGRGMEVVSG